MGSEIRWDHCSQLTSTKIPHFVVLFLWTDFGRSKPYRSPLPLCLYSPFDFFQNIDIPPKIWYFGILQNKMEHGCILTRIKQQYSPCPFILIRLGFTWYIIGSCGVLRCFYQSFVLKWVHEAGRDGCIDFLVGGCVCRWWWQSVAEQLKQRDRVQRQAFEEIIHQC